MRRACIDIGSNTTRLLVADCHDGKLVQRRQERAFIPLGHSLDAEGRIAPIKLMQVADVVASQYRMASELGAEQIRCVATAGVRRASNGHVLADLVAGFCDGLALEVLSAEDEARFAFLGAVSAAAPPDRARVAVIDAGGGSTELVVGSAAGEIQWWESVPIGSGDVTVRWLETDPPGAAELRRARGGVTELFTKLAAPDGIESVIAVGGSATSLRTLAGPVLDAAALSRMMGLVGALSSSEISMRFGVDAARGRLLAGGLLILGAAAELFAAPLTIGAGGLREGLLLRG